MTGIARQRLQTRRPTSMADATVRLHSRPRADLNGQVETGPIPAIYGSVAAVAYHRAADPPGGFTGRHIASALVLAEEFPVLECRIGLTGHLYHRQAWERLAGAQPCFRASPGLSAPPGRRECPRFHPPAVLEAEWCR